MDFEVEDLLFRWYCTSEHIEAARRYIPSPVKILILVQSFVIAYLGFWMYENYQNDFYFQAYVNSSLQGSGFTVVALSSVGIFSAVAMGLYLKLRRTHRELEHLILTEHSAPEEQGSKTILEPHVEQHLIEMIRKSTPSDTTGASSSIPILKRESPQSPS
jgi:hypothetical protein